MAYTHIVPRIHYLCPRVGGIYHNDIYLPISRVIMFVRYTVN